ncbi:hypothetical protein HK102_005186, partial [Quaeritorhiza haematococci]
MGKKPTSRKFPNTRKQQQQQQNQQESWGFDEWVEEALELEEKGDRYRDGEKARRFYERACEAYERAIAAGSSSGNGTGLAEIDVYYNWGRILLLLSEFRNPPYTLQQQHQLVMLAINKFRLAASQGAAQRPAAGEDQGRPTDYNSTTIDALFNLAQALRALAELNIQMRETPSLSWENWEVKADSGVHDGSVGSGGAGTGAMSASAEGRVVFVPCSSPSRGSSPGSAGNSVSSDPSVMQLLKEALSILGQVYQIQQTEHDSNMNYNDGFQQWEGPGETPESRDGMDLDGENPGVSFSPGRPTTLQSLCDTLLTEVQILNLMAGEVDDDAFERDLYTQAIAKLEETSGLVECSKSGREMSQCRHEGVDMDTDGESTTDLECEILLRWAEVLWSRGQTLQARLMDMKSALATNPDGHTQLTTSPTHAEFSELFQTALQKLEQALKLKPNHIEAMCDRADILCTGAETNWMLFCAFSHPPSSSHGANPSSGTSATVESNPHLTNARMMYSEATTLYTKALNLETSNVDLIWKLGDMNMNRIPLYPSSPKTQQ